MNLKYYYNCFTMRLSHLLCLTDVKSSCVYRRPLDNRVLSLKVLRELEDLSPWVPDWGPRIFNGLDAPMLFPLEALPNILLPHQDFCFSLANHHFGCSSVQGQL